MVGGVESGCARCASSAGVDENQSLAGGIPEGGLVCMGCSVLRGGAGVCSGVGFLAACILRRGDVLDLA